MSKVQTIIFAIIALLVMTGIVTLPPLFKKYGMYRTNQLDDRDLEKWQYDADGLIIGAESFYLDGDKETCWLLLHGYISSPNEMRGLGDAIHEKFGDTVSAIRFSGHGEMPSKLLGKDAYDWYLEADAEYLRLSKQCQKINVVGNSMGGAIALRLAEERELNRLYVLSPWLYLYPKKLWSKELTIRLFGWIVNYEKKPTSGTINDPELLGKHIGYYNMPLDPVLGSLQFIKETRDKLGEITEPVLIQQSKNDTTVDIASSILVNSKVASQEKKSMIYERSNHLLLEDYDREKAIEAILNF